MITLSERLKLILSFVPKGTAVCDVGTDHGYLPAALYLSGDYKSVTATDIREKPLENARNNIEKSGAKGVSLLLCDGLSGVSYDRAETVIIAGMGGDVISGIIDRCEYKEKALFILQPMTAVSNLREYLASGGFDVIKETAVAENNKIYSVMVCRYDGVKRQLSLAQKRIGKILPTSAENTEYINKQLRVTEKCISDLSQSEANPEMLKVYEKTRQEIIKIKEG